MGALNLLTVHTGLNEENGQTRTQNYKQADYRNAYSHAEFGRSNWLCNPSHFV
jgi:hypothetical protein